MLAIPNSWIYESAAIIEYLEDVCDTDPSLISMHSMRGGSDLTKRAMIRGGGGGVIDLSSEMFVACGYAAMQVTYPLREADSDLR